ncbi:MAG: GNAT family N-acetyltransferase [Clostridia bacterium]|nr:GNAT family N-acetyltransferase [Clostridia bacterium]
MSDAHRFGALFGSREPVTAEEFFAHLPPLETPRLLLRCARTGDAADIFRYAGDPEIDRYVLWEAHRTISDSRAMIRALIRQYHTCQPATYVIEERKTGRVIGTIGFTDYRPEIKTAELGYSLARTKWNMGYATEALGAMLALCFDRMRLHRAEAVHDVRNPASGRVMQKCGMRCEGTIRSRVFNKGEWCDVALWAMTEDDWSALTQA